MGAGLVVALVTLSWGLAACGSPEVVYEKAVARLKPVDVVSQAQVEQARRNEPGRALQISGVIQGFITAGEKQSIMLGMADGSSVQLKCEPGLPEVKTGARVRCLVQPADASPHSRLDLVDITVDRTPIEVLKEAARAALKIPVTDPEEIALSAAELQRRAPMPTRGGDIRLLLKRAIAYLNPRLKPDEVALITDSIMAYSAAYSVDPYLVVAVIAAESRFNPKARSYKGAMGLGQLMPATAAAHGVDAYDPVANLNVAIRILRRNLDKYGGDLYRALAAYNAGCGAVDRYDGVPPYRETREYLWRIYEYLCWLRGVPAQPRPK